MLLIVTMHEMDLRRIDLNLLVALDVLLDERNVTRAAARLGLSQPAVSRALARLRLVFGDALLVEGRGGYVLSARAEAIRPRLRAVLAEVGALLAARAFDPATAGGRLRLMTPDLLRRDARAAAARPPGRRRPRASTSTCYRPNRRSSRRSRTARRTRWWD